MLHKNWLFTESIWNISELLYFSRMNHIDLGQFIWVVQVNLVMVGQVKEQVFSDEESLISPLCVLAISTLG